MTAERWQRVKDILYDALEQPEPRREAWVRQAAAGDESLVSEVLSLMHASDSAEDFLEQPALAPNDLGTRLGRYKLIEEIGQGGMGAVYRAVRDDDEFEQEVAIKLIRHGMDSGAFRNRFLYERQLHAFLNHPNIARLLDGGTAPDGRPYFVMEFINGVNINEYCRTHALSIERRVALFRDVCAAVAYAHRNLIVHRDLKPGNILITPHGELKLLDFGIAKLLLPDLPGLRANQTSELHRVLTPDYASPEQVRGDPLTTATDVYSLGLVLYEILTERKAQPVAGRTPAEIERAVCDTEPVRPARLDRDLAGDLENIILKAVDKDPARRYSSVEQLSEDLRRYLEGRPVRARGSSPMYRFGKFVRRNKASVLAIAAVIVTLIGGIVTTTRQARIAERRFNDVRKLANAFLIEHDALAAIPGSTAQRAKLMGESLAYLDAPSREASGDRELQRELALAYEKMGDINAGSGNANIGNTAAALSSYRKAVAIREDLRRADDSPATEREVTEAYLKLAAALKIYGRAPESLEYEKKALASREAILAREPGNLPARRLVAASLQAIGLSLSEMGRDLEALDYRQRALTEYRTILQKGAKLETDYRGLALAYTRIGSVMSRLGRVKESAAAYESSLGVAREGIQTFPRSAILRVSETVALRALAMEEARAGKLEVSLGHARQANFVLSRLAADDPNDWRMHSMLGTSHFEVATALEKSGDRAAALRSHQTALAMRQDLAQRDPANAGARTEVAQSLVAIAKLGSPDRRALEQARAMLQDIERAGRLNSEGRKTLEDVTRLLAP